MMIINLLLVFEYAPTDSNIANTSYWRVHLKPFADKIVPRKANLLYLAAHLEILNLVLVIVSIIRYQYCMFLILIFS